MRKLVGALAVLTFGFAGAVTAQDEVELVGEWEWVVEVEGQSFAGIMEITDSDGMLGGTFSSDMGVAEIMSMEREGNMVTLSIDTGQGELFMELEFDGDEFTGYGSMQGMDIPISGVRVIG